MGARTALRTSPRTGQRGAPRYGLGGWSPRYLFAANEPGAWYDPSDLGTLYQESTGVTPVTAVEQAVGLALDKSRGLVLGPELVTNGSFDSGTTGWSAVGTATLTNVSGALQVSTNDSIGADGARQVVSGLVAGRAYRFMGSFSKTSGAAGATATFRWANGNVTSGFTTVGTTQTSSSYSGVIFPTGTEITIGLINGGLSAGGGGPYLTAYDNISVRELSGTHLIQPTASSRPVLRARYNLLTYSEQFDNAAWQQNAASASANAAVAPDGTLTADKILENTATASHSLFQAYTYAVAGVHQFSFWAKAAERTWVRTRGEIGLNYFDLANGTIGTLASGVTATMTNVGNDWFLIRLTRNFTVPGTTNIQLGPGIADATDSYTGVATSGVLVWGADLRRANDTYLPYQRIAAATDYDTVGFPVYLSFDGSDDSMYTGGNLDLSATDKVTVWAGVTKLSDATRGIVAELGNNAAAGGWHVNAPHADANATFSFTSTGSVFSGHCLATPYAAPQTRVLTGIGDIAGDVANIRADGVLFTNTNDQGTGNYSSAVLNVGRRDNASLPFNGRLYQLIVRGAATLDALITQADRWVGQKQGRTL